MAERAAPVPYTPYSTEQSSGGGGTAMGVHADSSEFGGQVDASLTKLGDTGFEMAQKQQGVINETMMTNADAALAVKVGQIKGAYLQNTGLAAQAAYPQYQADLEAARQDARANLPPAAARGFDMLSVRTIANHISDGSTYAAGQVKQAQIDSGTNLSNVNVQAVLDPSVASDPERVQYHQDSAIHGLQMTLDENHPGLKTDPETGTASFDDSTPQGQALKANFESAKDNIITQVQTNRFDTLAKVDPLGAFNIYQGIRDDLPKTTQVHLDATFAPKIFNANVNNSTTNVLSQSEQQYRNMLLNPSSVGSNSNNLGNVKTSSGAAQGTQDFVNPATPVDGVILTANTLRNGYQGLTLEQIGKKWTGESSDKVSAWVKNASNASGLSADTVPDLNDPQQLSSLLKGIGTAEKSPADRARFTDDVISQGVQSSLSGSKPQTTAASSTSKSYGTNADGSPLTQADYYRTHSEDVLQRADAQSEQDMPGDLQYKKAMRETVTNYMNKVISNQGAQYMMDNKSVVRAINGEMTKGNPPQTEAELRSIPGMASLLDRVAVQDPKFTDGIPTMIAKVARRSITTNSPNGYDTIMRTLEPNDPDHPNKIASQDHLDRLLGRSDGTGINMKDYTDAKQVIEADQPFKDSVAKNMTQVSSANGNVDGKGQQRALDWYNQLMVAKKVNDTKGDKALSTDDLIKQVNDAQVMPSRMQQIANQAQEIQKVPVLTDKAQFDVLPSGSVYIRNGQQYRKP